MNVEQARFNMIEQQIRPWEVLDPRVLDLLTEVPREQFVPEEFRNLAFADMMIPLNYGGVISGEVMMQPKQEARLIQALSPKPTDSVLEIGTGSGYVTALLSQLSYFVDSVEINESLAEQGEKNINSAGISNVRIEVGDGCRGWAAHAPYDCILLTGSVAEIHNDFRKQLKQDGRLVAITGQAPIMEAVVLQRTGDTGWETESVFDTFVPPLKNATREPQFEF